MEKGRATLTAGLFLILSGCATVPTGPHPLHATQYQAFVAINLLRRDPKSFVPDLQALKSRFEDKKLRQAGNPPTYVTTQEGVAAVDDAIRYCQSASPQPPLSTAIPLVWAARDHQLDQGKTGETGSTGSDGSSPKDRVERYGTIQGLSGENLSYGIYSGASGRDVVVGMLVDDGVSDRAHRKNLMEPTYQRVGVRCGPHKQGRVCVMDFAHEVEAVAVHK